jgi:hypothetical protein
MSCVARVTVAALQSVRARQRHPATCRATQTPAYGLGGRHCGPRHRRGPSASSLGRAPCLCAGLCCPGPRARARECQAAACMRSASRPFAASKTSSVASSSSRGHHMSVAKISWNVVPCSVLFARTRATPPDLSVGHQHSVRRRLSIRAHRLSFVSSTPTSPLRHPVLRSRALARHITGIKPQQGRRPPLPSPAILRTISTPPEPKNRSLGEPSSLPTTSPVHPDDELAGFWSSPPAMAPEDYIALISVFPGCFLWRRAYL